MGFDLFKELGNVGKSIGQELGGGLGGLAGKKGAAAGRNIGGSLGQLAGSAAPLALAALKTGGPVKGKKGKPVLIVAHGGEYVIPANAKPTVAQKKVVAMNKKKEAMKKKGKK